MTGFIRGLFGGNNNPEQPKEAFFLSEDDAKTFGDIDYMRTSKTVKRTFAKKKGQTEELESVKSISAMGAKEVKEGDMPKAKKAVSAATFASTTPTFSAPTTPAPSAPTTPAPSAAAPAPATTPQPTVEESTVTRTSDDSMDMFRNMARNIRR